MTARLTHVCFETACSHINMSTLYVVYLPRIISALELGIDKYNGSSANDERVARFSA